MLALIKAKIEPVSPPPPPGPYACSSSGCEEQSGANDVASASSTPVGPGTSSTTAPGKSSGERAVDPTDDGTEDDTEMDRMRRVLDSMLGKLQSRIQAAEQALDGKIQLLDEDRDGIISSSELKDTMKKILKRYPTDAEAEAFVLLLDEDRDGAGTCCEKCSAVIIA